MPAVWIPALMRDLTAGQEVVRVPGQTVREVIDGLEERFPGMRARLCDEDGLRPGIIVIVDREVSHRRLRQAVNADSEVHFLPAISGGCQASPGTACANQNALRAARHHLFT
jgi:molybdopterin synthase sulfur carrier subunit